MILGACTNAFKVSERASRTNAATQESASLFSKASPSTTSPSHNMMADTLTNSCADREEKDDDKIRAQNRLTHQMLKIQSALPTPRPGTRGVVQYCEDGCRCGHGRTPGLQPRRTACTSRQLPKCVERSEEKLCHTTTRRSFSSL